MKSKSGFTIVELIITITVIGILAAIIIVSYKGVQDRAYEAKAASIVHAYETGLKMYRARHGHYPDYAGSGGGWVCLGRTSQYPAKDGFAEGQCERYGPGESQAVWADDDFADELATVMDQPVSGLLPIVKHNTGRARGVSFLLDEVHKDSSIDYYTKGPDGCPRGEKEISNGNTLCIVYIDGLRNDD